MGTSQRIRNGLFIAFVAIGIALSAGGLLAASGQGAPPAPWGSDHVGKSLPDYMTGGECLFCHRDDVGNTWQPNRHNLAMNIVTPDSPAIKALRETPGLAALADEITMEVGRERLRRFLKPNGRYGQAALLSAAWTPPANGRPGQVLRAAGASWDDDRFAEGCAGCHATGVETGLKAYSAFSHDCFVCHGIVENGHQGDKSVVLLAKSNTAGVQVEMSICAQCHLRSGKSKSTGLPYPNQFVPGDNLILDYEADFSGEHLRALNPADRHIFENVRDVVLRGDEELTCLTCHDIHKRSTRKHRTLKKLQRDAYCAACHDNLEDWTSLTAYEVHSEICGY